MPIPVPIIAALIGAGVSGTEIGLQASGAFQPSTSGATQADQAALAKQQADAKAAQEKQLFAHAAPDVQARTGGSLADPSFAAMVAEMAGAPADVNLAQQTIFGNASPGLAAG